MTEHDKIISGALCYLMEQLDSRHWEDIKWRWAYRNKAIFEVGAKYGRAQKEFDEGFRAGVDAVYSMILDEWEALESKDAEDEEGE